MSAPVVFEFPQGRYALGVVLVDPVTGQASSFSGLGGPGADREITVTTYRCKSPFPGASVDDMITATELIDVSGLTPVTVSTIWRNQTTAVDLSDSPSAFNLELTAGTALTSVLGTDGATPPVIVGTGVRGWLRGIYEKLASTLTVGGTVVVSNLPDTQPVSASALPLPSGAATETTLAQVRDAIKAQIDIASSIWTDNSGMFYVRRDLVNEGTGVVTVSFAGPTGAAATPGAGLRPLSTVERDVTQALFDATAAGTGYAAGDVLARVLIIDANSSPSVTAAIWVNLSTGGTIAAPTAGTYERADETVSVRQSGAWTAALDVDMGDGTTGAKTQRITFASNATLSALGAVADAPATADNGSFSLMSFIKRGLANWTTLIGRVPAAVVSGFLPVDALATPGTPRTQATSAAAASIVLTATCRRVSMYATQGTFYSIAGAASSTSHYIAGGERLDFNVPANSTISVLQETTAGSVRVTELL